MTDIRIATDYLQDLFEKLSDGRQDPARVDWPFAAECWRTVCGEIEQLRHDNSHAGLRALYQRAAAESERLRRERDAALEAIRAWELASELEMKTWPGEGG